MAGSETRGGKGRRGGALFPRDGSYVSLAMSLMGGGEAAQLCAGGRDQGGLKRLRAALVFTDVVGATELKQSQGDERAWVLMGRHHELLRGVLESFPEGMEVETAGDSFLLSFGRPGDAVCFALELQSRLRRWSSGDPPLRDRVGIHVGEVFVIDEDGSGGGPVLFGMPVDACWRVMSLAVGNQILLTRAAHDMARVELDGRDVSGLGAVEWVCHGRYQLRGVSEAMEVFEVGERGMAAFVAPVDLEKSALLRPGVVPPWMIPTGQQLSQNPS